MPVDTITNKVNWYRALDTYGQTSSWHPSLQSTDSYPDVPLPPGLSGSGVNIAASRYQTFEESGLPPLSLASVSVLQQSGGYHGSKCIKLTATLANGTIWFGTSSTAYNVKLTPNKRWILSLYCTTPTAIQRSFSVLLQTATTQYSVTFTTSGIANTWQRVSTPIDLRGDAASGGTIGIKIIPTGADLLVDAIMLEERIGDGSEPSAYSGESGAVDGDQVLDATLSVDKLAAGTIGAQTINLNGSGSIIQSSNYAVGSAGWQIEGDGSAEFANVTVRGTLNAADLKAGTILAARYGNDTIGTGPIVNESISYVRGSYTTQTISSTSGTVSLQLSLTVPAATYRGGIAIFASMASNTAFALDTGQTAWVGVAIVKSGSSLSFGNTMGKDITAFAFKPTAIAFAYDSAPGTGAITYDIYAGQYNQPGTTYSFKTSILILELKR
jgi:hypothetical protein